MNDKHDIEPTANLLPKSEVDRIIRKLESMPKELISADEMRELLNGGAEEQPEQTQDNGREM